MKKIFLTFGKIINVEVTSGIFEGKYVSVIKEYDEINNILFISQPRISNLFVPLKTGESLTIHYLEGTMPCNFNSSIIDVIELDELSIFKIEGPSGIQKSDRRKHLRMPVFPVCHLKIVSQYSPTAVFTGVLTDISFSGVNIETQKQLNINEPLLLTFQLPKQNGGFYDITDLAIKTIWSKKINSRDFTGCAIQNFKPKQETSISDYLINIQRANNWENHVKKVVGSLIE